MIAWVKIVVKGIGIKVVFMGMSESIDVITNWGKRRKMTR